MLVLYYFNNSTYFSTTKIPTAYRDRSGIMGEIKASLKGHFDYEMTSDAIITCRATYNNINLGFFLENDTEKILGLVL